MARRVPSRWHHISVNAWHRWAGTMHVPPLAPPAVALLAELLGPSAPVREAALEDLVRYVPASRLRPHRLVSQSAEDRLLHARGQSFPDIMAMRCGRVTAFPDGVAYPTGEAEVRALLEYAAAAGARVIPYGGGTSVVGHVNPQGGADPVLTIDMRRMSRLLDLREEDRLATFGAGVPGPD